MQGLNDQFRPRSSPRKRTQFAHINMGRIAAGFPLTRE